MSLDIVYKRGMSTPETIIPEAANVPHQVNKPLEGDFFVIAPFTNTTEMIRPVIDALERRPQVGRVLGATCLEVLEDPDKYSEMVNNDHMNVYTGSAGAVAAGALDLSQARSLIDYDGAEPKSIPQNMLGWMRLEGEQGWEAFRACRQGDKETKAANKRAMLGKAREFFSPRFPRHVRQLGKISSFSTINHLIEVKSSHRVDAIGLVAARNPFGFRTSEEKKQIARSINVDYRELTDPTFRHETFVMYPDKVLDLLTWKHK